MTTLAEVIETAEKKLERPLAEDEILLVGRMVELEQSTEDIIETLSEKVVIPEDDELQTIRYEAVGQGVTPIPAAPPPEELEA